MTARRSSVLAVLALLATAACSDDEGSPLAPEPDPVPQADAIFTNGFADGVTFEAFGDSKVDAVQVDESVAYSGNSSMRVTVPAEGASDGFFAGGVLKAASARDLSGYDVLSFWVRADRNATLNVAGFGNDNAGGAEYMVEASDLDVSGVWQKYMIPIPDASVLTSEDGLFYFAEAHENGEGYTLWFDDIRFETVGAEIVRAGMTAATVTMEEGTTRRVEGLTATVNTGQIDVTVAPAARYYTFSSSDESIATVDADGLITVVGDGTAIITATLGPVSATGAVDITTGIPLSEGPPTPTQDAADVISVYSNAYTNRTVDTWSAVWDQADVEETQLGGDDALLYTNLVFAGIEFVAQPIDASAMTHFHMDIWTPDVADGSEIFKIKLVDFGADGSFQGGDDTEHEISITAPTLVAREWVGIDVPLTAFANMTGRGAIAQLIISGDPNTVYMDNVYFYSGEATPPPPPPAQPTVAAPTPAYDAANVISLFSDPYTDVTVDSWSASWDAADVTDTDVAGNAVKLYENLTFAGIDFTSAPIDASSMTNFRMDFWTPDATDGGETFLIKLVDFGADGVYQGGDDVEHEITLDATTNPAIGTGSWFTLDIPLSDFTNLTTRGALAQMIISGAPNTVYVDNVLFYQDLTVPTVAAPTPTDALADVISLFSDAYTDVTVDTWSADWDVADVEDIVIDGDAAKRYTNLTFAGIEFTSQTIDASGMTHFRFDFWTPDPTDGGQVFKVKLVDFGPDGVWSGNDANPDDVEHEITIDASYTPALSTGNWVSYDIPLSEFTNLTTTGSLAQLIISGDPGTVILDNIYFRR